MTLERISLTPHGPRISPIVAGMMHLASWKLAPAERVRWIEQSMSLGLRTFDHADIYGGYECEQLFGEALALEPALRERMQIVTKCGIALRSPNRPQHAVKHYDTSREHILRSVEQSLRNLQTDRIDLLLLHRPDPLLDPDEVAAAFIMLRDQGKALHFGVSNFTPPQFDLLRSRLPFPLVTNQVEFSVAQMSATWDGTFDHLLAQRIRPMIWSPLGGGAIFRGADAQGVRLNAALQAVGGEVGAGVDQVALAWALMVPAGPIPVLGTGRGDRLQRAVDALDLRLNRQQWFRIWEASAGHEVP